MQFRVIVITDPPTNPETNTQTHRQDRLQYTAPHVKWPVNSTKRTENKPRMRREDADRARFIRLLRHPARKRIGPILSTPATARGTPGQQLLMTILSGNRDPLDRLPLRGACACTRSGDGITDGLVGDREVTSRVGNATVGLQTSTTIRYTDEIE